jgi:CheY-like chemotaxis protein
MPVMDGIEAALKIKELDAGIPIVAMTANIMSGDLEVYKKSGMNDCVGKPFTSQELWQCLVRYFTPLTWKKEKPVSARNHQLHQNLINLFMQNNANKYEEITSALNAGDIKSAHRLAHTLNSNAAQLAETALQQAAVVVENRLKSENVVTPEQMRELKTELSAVIKRLKPQITDEIIPVEPSNEEIGIKKNRILIVDDDAANIMELTYILKSQYKLYAAKDGESALHQAKKHLPDLIMLDIIMPGISGFEVLKELQNSEETANIPVIFITALSNSGDENKGLALGAADYICKPFDEVIVKRRVSNQMSIVNLRREASNS